MMPDGLEYVSSWIDADLKVCWQLMRTEDESLLRVWTDNWKDLMDFEVVPVRTSDRSARDDGKAAVGKPLTKCRARRSKRRVKDGEERKH